MFIYEQKQIIVQTRKMREVAVDRRKAKTRRAIFQAFIDLLAEKSFNQLTVQDIIDRADVGRTTFYAHFETKDDLLRELCEELFTHILASAKDQCHHCAHPHRDSSLNVFCHLLHHLAENDNHVLQLLVCNSRELFLRYFKESLKELIKLFQTSDYNKQQSVPEDFMVNHIASSFVEMILWWSTSGRKEKPEQLDAYFRAVIEPIL